MIYWFADDQMSTEDLMSSKVLTSFNNVSSKSKKEKKAPKIPRKK